MEHNGMTSNFTVEQAQIVTPDENSESSKRLFFFWFIFLLLFSSLEVINQLLAISRWGDQAFFVIGFFPHIPIIILYFLWKYILSFSIIGLTIKITRNIALFVLTSSIFYSAFFFLSLRAAEVIRITGFSSLANRSAYIVNAIKEFEKINGKPPNSLTDLVPKYLPEVPKTGMGAYPDYKYQISKKPDEWSGNPWVLYVETPLVWINWDMFLYLPKQNYPQIGYDGYLEKVNDWAYVHE